MPRANEDSKDESSGKELKFAAEFNAGKCLGGFFFISYRMRIELMVEIELI